MLDITVIILTLNEEVNIAQALSSVSGWAKRTIVLDSGSCDLTVSIAKKLAADVFFREFDNYSNQRNFAITNTNIETEWVFFLDADEFLSIELKEEVNFFLNSLEEVKYHAISMRYKMIFLDQWIRHGAHYPVWLIRMFRKNSCFFEREVNEHAVINGKVKKATEHIIHKDNKNISFWLTKHISYAKREAFIAIEKNKSSNKFSNNQAHLKDLVRVNIYNRIPLFIRPFFFFVYVYIFRLGFLDGRRGFLFHFLFSFIYMFIIDAFSFEMKYLAKKSQKHD